MAEKSDPRNSHQSQLIARSLSIEDEDLKRFQEHAEFFLKNSGEGKILFNSGVKNNWHWRLMCFSSQNFRAYYALETFLYRAELVMQAFKSARENNFVPRNYFKDINKVAGFGCGPGSDLWGFKNFLKEEFAYSFRDTKKAPRFTGFDSELGWMPFVESLDFEFSCKDINVGFLQNMLPQDVIIMSYFVKSARILYGDEEEIREFWDALEKKANFVMVLNEQDAKLHDLLKSRGYKDFMVRDPLSDKDTHVYCLFQTEFSLLTARRQGLKR